MPVKTGSVILIYFDNKRAHYFVWMLFYHLLKPTLVCNYFTMAIYKAYDNTIFRPFVIYLI